MLPVPRLLTATQVEVEVMVGCAPGIERRSALGTSEPRPQVTRDGELRSAHTAEHTGRIELGGPPTFGVVRLGLGVTFEACVVPFAAAEPDRYHVCGPVPVSAAGLIVDKTSVDGLHGRIVAGHVLLTARTLHPTT